MKNDGFTTVDAVVAIALTGLLIAGMGPLFRAYSSDFPDALERNREGIAFHRLSCDLQSSMERLEIPYWSAGPALQLSESRIEIAGNSGSLVLNLEGSRIRLADDEGSRLYGFRSPPVWELIEDSQYRLIGIRLRHDEELEIDCYFRERALGAVRDGGE